MKGPGTEAAVTCYLVALHPPVAGVQRSVIEQPRVAGLSATSMMDLAKAWPEPSRSVRALLSAAVEPDNTMYAALFSFRASKSRRAWQLS